MELDNQILTNLNFKNQKLIGMGVFIRVYKADNEVGKTRCLKIIPANKFRREEWEASLRLRKTNNENVIICDKLYDTTHGLIVLEMDFIDGGDLKNYVDKHVGYFSSEEILDIVSQIRFFLLLFFFKVF
jgi:serine/threonine protein kinase